MLALILGLYMYMIKPHPPSVHMGVRVWNNLIQPAKFCKSNNELCFPLSVAQTIAKCPFTPGHEAVGEVSAKLCYLIILIYSHTDADCGSRTRRTS